MGDTPFDRAQFAHAVPICIPEAHAMLMVASAEDTILTKLEWYMITPCDQQWMDVPTILRVQRDMLDHASLTTWATQR